MLRYTHELTYADSKELFSKRQEILEETEMSLFLFLFPSLHDAYFCMHELYSVLLFEFIVIKVTRIKSNKFVAFWLVADGRVFDIQSIYLIFPLTKHNSLVTWASWSPKWRLSQKKKLKTLSNAINYVTLDCILGFLNSQYAIVYARVGQNKANTLYYRG